MRLLETEVHFVDVPDKKKKRIGKFLQRHGSRSGRKGRIMAKCVSCGADVILEMSDHYGMEGVCEKCGRVKEWRGMPGGISLFEWNKGRR
jgi:DNA-directed RNA polymerase subunit RPC12/RpoP